MATIDTRLPAAGMDAGALLKGALIGNAAFSAAFAIILLLASGPLSDFLALDPAWILSVCAVALFGWVGLVLFYASRPVPRPSEALAIIAGDAGWVVATVILLTGWPALLSEGGERLLIAISVVVGGFAILQAIALQRLRRA